MRASFERKKMSHRPKVIDEEPLHHSQTNIFSSMPIQPQPHDGLANMIVRLQQSLKEEKEIRMQTQEKMLAMQKRSIIRQDEFRRLLQQKMTQIEYSQEKQTSKSIINVKTIHKQLMKTFELYSQESHRQLAKSIADNESFLEKKIEEIAAKMRSELDKAKKLSAGDYEKIVRDIKHAQQIASTILTQNEEMRKRVGNLEFSIKTLNEQKQLLIGELQHKKMLIQKLAKQMMRNEMQKGVPSHTITQSEFEEIMNERKQVNKFFETQFMRRGSNSQFISGVYAKKDAKQSQSIKRSIESRAVSNKERHRSKLHTLESRDCTIELSQKNQYQETIEHLKAALAREKRKKTEYCRIISKLTSENQELSKIFQQLAQEEEKISESHDQNTQNNGTEKLFFILREFKRRLMVAESPNVNCGYGQSNHIKQELQALATMEI